MPAYMTFVSARGAVDTVSVTATLRLQDASVGVMPAPDGKSYYVKKATAFTAPQVTFVQNTIDAAPLLTLEVEAQNEIDAWPIATKALVLALIDETNRLRGALRGLGVANLPDVTPLQALAAVRTKAGTL